MDTKKLSRLAALAAMSLGLVGCAAMSGCQTSYAADIRNTTPQPVYAQMMEQFSESATMRASARLGPGDRAGLGPVVAHDGRAFLVVDTVGNPGTPVRVPLAAGTTTLEIIQTGDDAAGPLQVRIIGGLPPSQPMLGPPPQPGK